MQSDRDARPRHRPGELLEVEIEKVVNRGLGLARVEGVVCLVRGAYPGERWRVRVSAAARGHLEATGIDRLSDHPHRQSSPCAVFPECGGCAHLDLDPEGQRAIKRDALEETLVRAHVDVPAPVELVASPTAGWRLRATLHVGEGAAGADLGFREVQGHRIVPTETCLQLSEKVNGAVADVRRVLGRLSSPNQIEQVTFTESITGDQLVITLEGRLSRETVGQLRRAASALPGVSGVGLELPGRPWLQLIGKPFVLHRVGPLTLRQHAQSFFQVNRFLIESLVGEVRRHVDSEAPLLDLYSGVGLFSLGLAGSGRRVVAIEGHPLAAADARANGRRAGLSRADYEVIQGDVGSVLPQRSRVPGEVVVADPPRAGLGPPVVEALLARRPARIICVSCDPATLARDVRDICRRGARLTSLRAFDLFPGTSHVETVAVLDLDA